MFDERPFNLAAPAQTSSCLGGSALQFQILALISADECSRTALIGCPPNDARRMKLMFSIRFPEIRAPNEAPLIAMRKQLGRPFNGSFADRPYVRTTGLREVGVSGDWSFVHRERRWAGRRFEEFHLILLAKIYRNFPRIYRRSVKTDDHERSGTPSQIL